MGALVLSTCSDKLAGPVQIGPALIAVEPKFASGFGFAGFNLVLDSLELFVIRPPSDTIARVGKKFFANQVQTQLSAQVQLQQPSEDLILSIEYLSGTTLLFSGTQTVTIKQGFTPNTPQIPVNFVGPGSNVASLQLAPRDTTILAGGGFPFRITALDAQQSSVTSFYVSWSSSNGLDSVDGAGVLKAQATRGTFYVTAKTPPTLQNPTGVVDSTSVTITLPAASIVKVSGDQQQAPAGTQLPQPLVAQVKASDGVGVAGVTVTFAAPAGGAVVPASALTDTAGKAQTLATLGPAAGLQNFTATASVGQVTFGETAQPVGPVTATWTGATSNNWFLGSNWSTGVVPGAIDDAIIPPSTPNAPLINATANIAGLTIQSGATLSVQAPATLTVSGNLDASGTLAGTGGTPIVVLAGTTKTAKGTLSGADLTVTGSYTLAGALSASPRLAIQNTGATLTLGGFTAAVTGSFQTATSGLLVMTNPADQLTVTGSATFDGANELNSLSAGTLSISGNLTQLATTSADAFHTSGTHLTVFTGASPTLNFATPGNVPGSSHFEQFRWTGTGTLTLASDVYAHGTVDGNPGISGIIASAGRKLQVGSFVGGGTTFNNTTLVIDQTAGAPIALDNVTFTSMATTAAQLTVNHPGTGGPFSFNNLSFSTVPTTGFYLSANDVDGVTSGVLTINLVNPLPGTPGTFVQKLGGAVVNWPAAAPANTWAGTISTDWSVAGNWSKGTVPTNADDVVIPATTNKPVVTSSCSAKSILVNSGGQLNLGAFNCQVQGNVFVDGTTAGTGLFQIQAAGQVRGNLRGLIVGAAVSANSGTAIVGNLTVTGAGASFALNGQSATVTGNLAVQGGGLLVMTNPADNLNVQGGVSFDGASESGSLTAGSLLVGTNFTQAATSSGASFRAGGTHTTILSSASPTIAFATPGSTGTTSGFQGLQWSGGGTMTVSSDIVAGGQLVVSSVSASTITGANHLITANGIAPLGPMTFNATALQLNMPAGGNLALSDFTFQGMSPTATYFEVLHPGTAGPFTLTNFSFAPVPTTGLYLKATDTDGAGSNGALTLNLSNPTPATPGSFTSALTGAVINWPAPFVWTGAVSTDWNTAGNWSLGAVPGTSSDVQIPSGPVNQPLLTSLATIHGITVQANATLTLGSTGTLQTSGDVVASAVGSPGGIVTAGGGQLLMSGPANVAGNVPNFRMSGTVTATGGVNVTGSVSIAGPTTAVFVVGGNTVNISGSLSTGGATQAGELDMTNPAGAVVVATDASFQGGDETGHLTAGTLSVTGNFLQSNIGGSTASFVSSGTHTLVMSGSTTTITFNTPGTGGRSSIQNLQLTCPSATTISAGSPLELTGNLSVSNGCQFNLGGSAQQTPVAGSITVAGAAVLNLNGNTLSAGGDFSVLTGGLLKMVTTGDQLQVQGNATFDGANELNSLSAGNLIISGNLTQLASTSADAFHTSGTHLTVLAGTSPTISFATPGNVPGSSHFEQFRWGGTGTLTLASDVFAHGGLDITGVGGTTIGSANHKLQIGVLTGSAVTLDNTTLVIDQPAPGTPIGVTNVTFQNMSPSVNQLTVNHTGLGGPFTFNNLTFSTIPNSGFFYLSANDIDGAASGVLTIDVTNSNPANGSPFFQGLNGAVVNWPPPPPAITWTGAVDNNWNSAGNWSGGVVPIQTDNTVIPSGTPNSPTLIGTASVADLTIQSGAIVSIGASSGLAVFGNASSQGSVSTSGGGSIILNGIGKTASGNFGDLSVTGSYSLSGNFNQGLANLLAVSGTLTLNGHTLVAGNFSTTTANGIVVMTQAADSLIVQATAIFDGGNETGNLTAGVIEVSGDFLQNATSSPASFSASPGNKLVFNTAGTSNLVMFTPGTGSQVGSMDQINSGVVQLGSNILVSAGGVTVSNGQLNTGGHTLTNQGTFVTQGPGTLVMQSSTDSVLVTGLTTFGGGDETGLLSDGVLKLSGSFVQNSATSPLSFAASGSHQTVMGGPAGQVATFASPGTGAVGSHFNSLDITAAIGGLTINSDVFVDSALITKVGAAAPLLTGGGKTVTVRHFQVQGLKIDNAPIVLNEGTTILNPQQFDGVTFQNFPTVGVTQLTINAAGAALTVRPITFNNTTFTHLTTVGAGAFYVKATSTNGLGFNLTMQGASESPQIGGNGPSFTSATAPASVNWP